MSGWLSQVIDQDYLLQARQMQALSFAVHIPLVCFGMALPTLILFLEWRAMRTGQEVYRTLARRWSRILVALFAVGVVTGTVLSFEMGLLWPQFVGTFGSVFGLGFAIEGFSFFVEAIFIGVYVYGWDRLSPRWHFASGIPIVLTGVTGSFMVITVNAWMNNPSGFRLQNGQVVDVDPVRALFANPFLWHEFVHMYIAAFMVTGFLMAGCYAVSLLRGRSTPYHRVALAVPLTAASVAAPAQIVVGDWAARTVGEQQPIKLAALEGLGATTSGAPVHLLGWYVDGDVRYGIEIPRLLSLLAYHDPDATVQGLLSFPPEDLPPVNVVRIAFQTMVGIGSALALLAVIFLYIRIRAHRLPASRWFYRALVLAGPAAVVALIAGWVTTEVGRQPWVVYGVMRTNEAVTAASGIPIGYAVLAAIYLGVVVGVGWILHRLAIRPLPADPPPPRELVEEGVP
ncbi:cytochrome ubiquinol oxidase subunit I [Pseudonocardia xinjiangensis]|uniref:cytochrome ubiquinol oxidase subunit I n=1 Tax=Pseudonocardia xinjiangensis TaxID=75289 RepID=UPI003D8D99C0